MSSTPRVTIELEVDAGNEAFSAKTIALTLRRHVVMLTPALTSENNGTITVSAKSLTVDGIRYEL